MGVHVVFFDKNQLKNHIHVKLRLGGGIRSKVVKNDMGKELQNRQKQRVWPDARSSIILVEYATQLVSI